jgi:hypothetical protein
VPVPIQSGLPPYREGRFWGMRTFSPRRVNARCPFSQGTFPGTHSTDETRLLRPFAQRGQMAKPTPTGLFSFAPVEMTASSGVDLRRREEWCEATLEHLLTSVPQSIVAPGEREAKAVRDSVALLVHPVHARPPPRRIFLEGLGQGCASAQTLS